MRWLNMVIEPVSALPAFQDRYEAGERLAEVLKNESFDNALVLGLARGGVAVAQRVAEKLALPLDVMVARKIQSPHQPELAIGAVAPHGMTLVDLASKQHLELSDDDFAVLTQRAREEMQRRIQEYRGSDEELPELEHARVILVDDGLATGLTARAAIRSLRRHPGVDSIVLAVPVGAPDTVESLQQEADKIICVVQPSSFHAVGCWYQHFEPTSDAEVLSCLKRK